jgi:hypothetical protein
MAVQTATGKIVKPQGAATGTQATKQGSRAVAHGETYKSDLTRGQLARGGLGPVRKDPITGGDTSRTAYGQNAFSGASSAGVEESSKLSDFDINPPDPVLDEIVKVGIGSKQNDKPQELVGQERPISDTPFPTAFGCTGAKPGPKI